MEKNDYLCDIIKNQYTKTDYEKTINSIHDAGRTMAVSTDFSVTA